MGSYEDRGGDRSKSGLGGFRAAPVPPPKKKKSGTPQSGRSDETTWAYPSSTSAMSSPHQ